MIALKKHSNSWIEITSYFLLFTAIFIPKIFEVGFLSDDWNMIKSNQTLNGIKWIYDSHHISPFLNSLFHLVSSKNFTSSHFHIVATLFHFINILLIFRIAKILKFSPQIRIAGILFCVLNVSGLEALLWCCSLGYIINTTLALTAYNLYLKFTETKSLNQKRLIPFALGVIQLISFYIWDDWGLMITPSLIAFSFFSNREGLTVLDKLKLFVPSLISLFIILVIRSTMSVGIGYAVSNTLLDYIRFLFSSHIAILLPNVNKTVLLSGVGATLSIIIMLSILKAMLTHRFIPKFLAPFIIFQIPFLAYGYPQSRYFYILTFLFFLSLMEILSTLKISKLSFSAIIALLCFHCLWGHQRLNYWISNSNEAIAIKTQVAKVYQQNKDIIVINLPDHLPHTNNLIWPPVLWRHGIQAALGHSVECATIAGPPFINKQPLNTYQSKRHLEESYPDKTLVEFVSKIENGSYQFVLKPI